MPKAEQPKDNDRTFSSTLGIGLSGGGSRAAAFHRGTIQGLVDLGLLSEVGRISSVSGGSIFAAAWLSAQWRGLTVNQFLDSILSELVEGFIARSITHKAIKLALPSYTRTNLLAETFDRVLMNGMQLQHLPDRPLLCINTSVMNTGQVGKFSRFGFSSTGLLAPDESQGDSNANIPLPTFPVALAATASAAFPVGLPPVYLARGRDIPENWGGPMLADHRRFALTDGGVLENLGIQTLLRSRRFGAWDLIVSDAGRKDDLWRPGGIGNMLQGILMGAISMSTLVRVTSIMNSKQNRHMRLQAFGEMEHSWLIDALRTHDESTGLRDYLSHRPRAPRRRILFIRLNQTFTGLMASIPRWRIREIAARANYRLSEAEHVTPSFLRTCGIDLSAAIEHHRTFGGDRRIEELNRVGTHFSALSSKDAKDLGAHAFWQMHAARALYWD